ncbi:hypothetical protein WJX73_009490 [Symbiochloris irregularis]|uniref:Uncharacterized protein n=1 Tax=Symbiochloris irregularis TaxID=706552 RepID=A0AAW1PNK7_9CHLO
MRGIRCQRLRALLDTSVQAANLGFSATAIALLLSVTQFHHPHQAHATEGSQPQQSINRQLGNEMFLATAQSGMPQNAALTDSASIAPPLRSANLPPIPTDLPPLAALEPAASQQFKLSNGLRVVMIEDHEVPVVKGQLLMLGGQRTSPKDKVGLATIAGQLQRSGGTVNHFSQALNDELEELSAVVESFAAPDATGVGFSCLKEDTRHVLGLFAEVLQQPALPQDRLQLAKSQALDFVRHMNDDTQGIPGRELEKVIYGADSPFARTPQLDQIASIQREDIQQYLQQWQRPDTAILGVLGDFDSSTMRDEIERALGDWSPAQGQPSTAAALPLPPLPEQPRGRQVWLIDLPGSSQASLASGELGVSRTDPDAPALDILSDILNGFGGSLFDQIRSRQGLAYSISGGWNTGPIDHPGLFFAGGSTASPAELLDTLGRSLENVRKNGVTEAEVQAAKSETLNSFVFNFASRSSQLLQSLGCELLGLPQDTLYRYREAIEAVTAEDAVVAASQLWCSFGQKLEAMCSTGASQLESGVLAMQYSARVMLSAGDADAIAAGICCPPIWDPPQHGRVRLRVGTQADEMLDLQFFAKRVRKARNRDAELWTTICRNMNRAVMGALLEQDETSQRNIIVTMRQTSKLDFADQPGGRPLTRAMRPGHETADDVCLVLFNDLKDHNVGFDVTPDHLERWGLSEEEAWQQAFATLDKTVTKKFRATDRDMNSDDRPGTFFRLPKANAFICWHLVKEEHLSASAREASTATAIMLPRVLRSIAKILECNIWQLILAPVDDACLLISRCDDHWSMNVLYMVAREYYTMGPRPLSKTPLQLADTLGPKTLCTFKPYAHIGQQYALRTSLLGDQHVLFAAYPLNDVQHEAFQDKLSEAEVELRMPDHLPSF